MHVPSSNFTGAIADILLFLKSGAAILSVPTIGNIGATTQRRVPGAHPLRRFMRLARLTQLV